MKKDEWYLYTCSKCLEEFIVKYKYKSNPYCTNCGEEAGEFEGRIYVDNNLIKE